MMLAMIFGGVCNVFFFFLGGGVVKCLYRSGAGFATVFFYGCSPPKFGRNDEKLTNIFQVVSMFVWKNLRKDN